MGYCDNLLANEIKPSCENPVVAGIEANGVIINREDVDFSNVEFDETNKNVIKNLKLKSNKKGYKVHVPTTKPFSGTTTTMEAGTNRNSFTNNLGFVILDNGPEVTQIVDALASGEFVVVYENKFKNTVAETGKLKGGSTFQVIGYYQGLKAATLENDKYSEDTEGGWNVSLTETKVPKSALFLYAETEAATRTLVESLTD